MSLKFWMRLKHRLDVALPLTIAIFAAILAINDLFAGKYGSDEIKISNLRNNSYQWFQSKGIKETIVEGQVDLLKVLLQSGSVSQDKEPEMQAVLKQMEQKIQRYRKEKKEILLGSKALSEQEWAQETDGKLGQVIGAKEYDSNLEKLGAAANFFDIANMLFQLCLVTGSVAMLIESKASQWIFFQITIAAGAIGIFLSLQGIWAASVIS